MERESTTTSAQLIDCLTCYPFQVEFPSNHLVMATCQADCPPNHVASQEAVGQFSPGRLWCNTNRKNSSLSIQCLMLRADCPSNIKHCTSTRWRTLISWHAQPTNHTNIKWNIWAVMDLFVLTKGNTIVYV